MNTLNTKVFYENSKLTKFFKYLSFSLLLIFSHQLLAEDSPAFTAKVIYTLSGDCEEDATISFMASNTGGSGYVSDFCADPNGIMTVTFTNNTGGIVTVNFTSADCTGTFLSTTMSSSLFSDGVWSVSNFLIDGEPNLGTCNQGSCDFSIMNSLIAPPSFEYNDLICSETETIISLPLGPNDSAVSWFLDNDIICAPAGGPAPSPPCPNPINLGLLSPGSHTICANVLFSVGDCSFQTSICEDFFVEDCSCIFSVDVECVLCGGEVYTVVDGLGNVVIPDDGTELNWTFFHEDGSISYSMDNEIYHPDAMGGFVHINSRECNDECIYLEFTDTGDCDNCELIEPEMDNMGYTYVCNPDGSITFTATYFDENIESSCFGVKWIFGTTQFFDNPLTLSFPSGVYQGSLVIVVAGGPEGTEKCADSIRVDARCECKDIIPSGLACGNDENWNPYITWDPIPQATHYEVALTPNSPQCCEDPDDHPLPSILITEDNLVYLNELASGENLECFAITVRARCVSFGWSSYSETFCSSDCNFGEGIIDPREDTSLKSWGAINPFKNQIDIFDLDPQSKYQIELYNNSGEIVKDLFLEGTSDHKISASQLVTGIYFLNIKCINTHELKTLKLLKVD